MHEEPGSDGPRAHDASHDSEPGRPNQEVGRRGIDRRSDMSVGST